MVPLSSHTHTYTDRPPQDLEFEEGTMAGEPVKVGRYAGSMRRHLFKEHLGLLETPDESVDVSDATSDDFYKGVWLKISSKNTDVFEKVGVGA